MAPANDPSLWSVLLPLLPVVAGGVLALLGVAIGPAISQWLQSRSVSRATRIQRFEELFGLLQQHDEWINLKTRIDAFGEKHELPSEPLAKAFAISAIYFPDFLLELRKLDVVTANYGKWTAAAAIRRLEGKISEISDGFDDVHQPYLRAFNEVRERLIQYGVSRKTRV